MRGFFMLFSKRLFSFKILDNVDPLCEVCNFAGDKKPLQLRWFLFICCSVLYMETEQ